MLKELGHRLITAILGILPAMVLNAGEPVPSQVIPLTVMPTVECPAHLSVGVAYNLDNPASFLYPEWSNQYVHKFDDVPFPDSLVILMKDFCMPTDSTRITDKYGYRPRRTRVHYGLDIKVLTGDTIKSAFDGKVRISRYERRGYGHYLVIRHPNGLETVYAHLSKKLVKENQIVRAGEPIGLGGNTGRSTGSHLHFETRILGKPINPAFMFNFSEQCAETDVYVYRKADNKEVYYKVKSGDTLTRIAAKNETSVSSICKLNGISRNTILRVGQTLRVN